MLFYIHFSFKSVFCVFTGRSELLARFVSTQAYGACEEEVRWFQGREGDAEESVCETANTTKVKIESLFSVSDVVKGLLLSA